MYVDPTGRNQKITHIFYDGRRGTPLLCVILY
jgi:hypothetical protein